MAQCADSHTKQTNSRARSVALVGLSIAIIAVCSWVTIPLGPIPLTLQMFAVPLVICILTPKQAVAAMVGYLLLGAIGIPVFSGMRGGLGVVLGPTGGFLMGYLPGVLFAALMLYLTKPVAERYRETYAEKVAIRTSTSDASSAPRPNTWQRMREDLLSCIFQFIAGLMFTFVAYATGWLWFMIASGVSAEAAFVACIAPFILPDIAKVIAAVVVAQPIRAALLR